jgi:hypothetical protein
MEELARQIRECKTMPELDNLRIKIVQDSENFLTNQKEFIKKKNKLQRIPLSERNL